MRHGHVRKVEYSHSITRQAIPIRRNPPTLHSIELDLFVCCWIAGATYNSAFAQFGGKPFPAYSNGVSATGSTILREAGIPNVFMTDDYFFSGRTAEECQANINKAIEILSALGFRINPAKVTPPSQQVQ